MDTLIKSGSYFYSAVAIDKQVSGVLTFTNPMSWQEIYSIIHDGIKGRLPNLPDNGTQLLAFNSIPTVAED